MSLDTAQALRGAGIQPSVQRLAIAEFVLATREHPSADEVFQNVHGKLPVLSRATVYNTLNLFAAKGLLRQLVLAEGRTVYDPVLEPHHHFIDDVSGRIEDIPWNAVRVGEVERLANYEVREYMVVMRGRKLSRPRSASHPAGRKRHR